MTFSNIGYIIGEKEIKEFRDDVERQTAFINNEINRFKPGKSIEDFGSLITTISGFLAIMWINKDIFLNYWIHSIFLFLIFVEGMNSLEYLKASKKDPKSFHDSKQLTIAYLLSSKSYVINSKYNDIAFAIIWAIGLAILICNSFEKRMETNILLIALFTLVFLLTLILMFNHEVLYDFFVWVHTKIITPATTIQYVQDKDVEKFMNNFHWENVLEIKRNQFLFILGILIRNLLIMITILIIIFSFFLGISWDIFKDVFCLSIFQILTYVTLSSFLSFKKIEDILENQKNLLIRISTSLDKTKPGIDIQQLNSAKDFLKLSKLFVGYKQNFALLFTWVEVRANGELNIEENYNLLYRELGIPPD